MDARGRLHYAAPGARTADAHGASMTTSTDQAFAHFRAGRLREAELLVRDLLRNDASDPNAWRLYGLIAQALGQIDFAITAHGKAAALAASVPEFHFGLGNALRVAGKLEPAVAAYERALQLRPDYADALINLGIALMNLARRDEAASVWEQALRIDPNDLDALTNLSNAERVAGRVTEAIAYGERALAVAPPRAATLSNLASAYLQRGDLDAAVACCRRALALSPDSPVIHSNLLLYMTYPDSVPPAEVFAEHRRWDERFGRPHAARVRPHENDRAPDRRLRIGYVSPDFRDHAVAYFIEPVLARHDRERFEVFCYMAMPLADAVTRRLQSHGGHAWRSLYGVSDAHAAEMIRGDRIDILLDLAVHTTGNRLTLFAHKPAPVQATWLGYAGTTGMDAIDWRLSDAIVDPPGLSESLHSERLMRLPRTQWCYQPPADAPPVAPAPPSDRNGFVTFGNATNLAKVTPTTMDLWADVLRAVSGSRLRLKAVSLSDATTADRLRENFAARGVEPARLLLEGAGDLAAYLSFWNDVDVCLDTFPFTGGTTTCHALWMGVPTVTMTGPTSVSRVAASVLSNSNLSDLVTASRPQFVEVACALAADRDRRARLRCELRQSMLASPLCDAPGFTRELEDAYRRMWHDWCTTAATTAT